jgi:hypothetical protein
MRQSLLRAASLLLLWATVWAAPQDASKATTPPQGSAERKALLDAVRARLEIKSQFKVYHLKVQGEWAFFHGGEVVDADGELQETDLDVQALLQRKTVAGTPGWYVAEIWTLPTDDKLARAEFARRVRRRQQTGRIPAAILPDDL